MRGCDHRRLGQNIKQTLAIKAGLLAEGRSLGDGLHADSEQSVHHQLHRGSRSAWPQIEMLPADRIKNVSRGIKGFFVAAAEESQQALFRSRSAAGNRDVQYA